MTRRRRDASVTPAPSSAHCNARRPPKQRSPRHEAPFDLLRARLQRIRPFFRRSRRLCPPGGKAAKLARGRRVPAEPFPEETQKLLAECDGGRDEELKQALVRGLKKVILGPAIYAEKRFGDLALGTETSETLASNAEGEDRARLNRLRLDDALLRRRPSQRARAEGGLEPQPGPATRLRPADPATCLPVRGSQFFPEAPFARSPLASCGSRSGAVVPLAWSSSVAA